MHRRHVSRSTLVCCVSWYVMAHTSALFAVFMVMGPAASAESYLRRPTQPQDAATSSVAETPRIPVLPPEIAAEVEDIGKQIQAILYRREEKSEEEIEKLILAVERMVDLRIQYQGTQTVEEKWQLCASSTLDHVHSGTSESLINLAARHEAQEQYGRGLPSYQRALALP